MKRRPWIYVLGIITAFAIAKFLAWFFDSTSVFRISVIVLLVILVATLQWRSLFRQRRTVFLDILQGILIGAGITYLVVFVILPNFYIAKVNGWTTMHGCGEPGDGLIRRAMCNVVFRGPINVPQEAMYWTTRTDAAGHTLSGAHDYVMHFPSGQLPPNNAFWSLTMGDAGNHFVPNPINRYDVSDRSGLVANPDGSVDIYIRNAAPTGHESNWLPAPTGNFIVWLRVYLPGQSVVEGSYRAPPIVEKQ
jgi:hypothetical protein